MDQLEGYPFVPSGVKCSTLSGIIMHLATFHDLSLLIADARLGSEAALNCLLEAVRPFATRLAERENSPPLRVKVGDSDLVQESLLDASRTFASFEGHTGEELTAWLRQILLNNLLHQRRAYLGTEKRDVSREQPWPYQSTESGVGSVIPDDSRLPPEKVAATEERLRVQTALERLPPEFRQVLRWRFEDGLTIPEIAERLQRTVSSAKKFLARAVQHFDRELGQL